MDNEKQRHTVFLRPDAWEQVQSCYQEDNCSTKNEIIEKAVRFYCGYLSAEEADDYLPAVLGSQLEAMLNMFALRIGKLMFKQAIEADMMMHIIAADTDIDEDTLERLRGRCVNDVKRTNGQIGFREILRFQKSV